jgi:hypothetical protein
MRVPFLAPQGVQGHVGGNRAGPSLETATPLKSTFGNCAQDPFECHLDVIFKVGTALMQYAAQGAVNGRAQLVIKGTGRRTISLK